MKIIITAGICVRTQHQVPTHHTNSDKQIDTHTLTSFIAAYATSAVAKSREAQAIPARHAHSASSWEHDILLTIDS